MFPISQCIHCSRYEGVPGSQGVCHSPWWGEYGCVVSSAIGGPGQGTSFCPWTNQDGSDRMQKGDMLLTIKN